MSPAPFLLEKQSCPEGCRWKSWGLQIGPGMRTRLREARIALCTPEPWFRGQKDNRQGIGRQEAWRVEKLQHVLLKRVDR